MEFGRRAIAVIVGLIAVADAHASRSIDIDSPLPSANVSCRTQLIARYAGLEPGDQLSLTLMNLDSGFSVGLQGPTIQPGAGQGQWSECLNLCYPQVFPNGAAILTVSVCDEQNQEKYSRSVAITIDTFGPAMNLTISPDQQCFGKLDNVISVDATMSDVSGVALWRLIIDGHRVASGGGSSNTASVHRTIKVADLVDGYHNILLVAYDAAGGSSGDGCSTGANAGIRQVDFVVDRTPPIVTIEKPTTYLQGTGAIRWSVNNDPDLVSLVQCQVVLDGALFATLGPDDVEQAIDTLVLADGVHTFRVEASDQCGNVGSDEVNFVVRNSGLGTPFGGNFTLDFLRPTSQASGYLSFRRPDTDELVNRAIVTVGADGQYEPVPVLPGQYKLSVRFDGWLRQTVNNVDLTGGPLNMDFELVNGDANHDNMVDLLDINEILIHFAETDSEGDLDHSGRVDLYDLAIVFLNAGQAGD